MKTTRMTVLAAGALLSIGTLSEATAQVQNFRDIKVPALHVIPAPQAKRIALANGMVIYLMENHELPLISGNARIRGGSRDLPADKAGLVGIYGQAWRTGGTEKQTGDQLDDFLESRAARVETNGGDDSTRVSFNALKGDFDAVFPVFLDVLRNPAFRQEKIDLAKTAANSGISRRNDDAQGILTREALKLGFGANSPYTRQAEYATIASITRDDLLAFHKKFVQPNNIILGLTGDFDSAAMEKKLRAAFESWPKGTAASRTAPAGIDPAKPGLYSIAKSDVTQGYIYFVGRGVQRDTPDYYAITVLNEIFGGGFSGRLMNDIRTARGLAYSVGGGIGMDWDKPGLFRVSMGTKSGTTVEAIGAVKNAINELTTKPFSDAEVADAKETLLNAFVFSRDSKGKVLNQRVELEFYGYPADWYDRYVAGIEKVTPADVERVAKKYVTPNQLAMLVVGNEKDFDKPLSSISAVTPIDITIPEPGAKPAGAAPAASNPAGLALVKKVQDFMGGKAKLDAIKAVHTVQTMSTKTPAGNMDMDMDALVRYPDSRRAVMKTPMGEMTMVSTPDAAFMMGPMGTQDLPGSQRDAMKNESKLEMIQLLRNAEKPGYVFTVTGSEKVDNIDAQVLDITADGATTKWWVDPATGRVLKRSSRGRQGETVTTLSDWKTFDGVNFATTYSTTANGEQVASGKITNIEVNPTIDPKVFEKPPAK
jgi:zinc protease